MTQRMEVQALVESWEVVCLVSHEAKFETCPLPFIFIFVNNFSTQNKSNALKMKLKHCNNTQTLVLIRNIKLIV